MFYSIELRLIRIVSHNFWCKSNVGDKRGVDFIVYFGLDHFSCENLNMLQYYGKNNFTFSIANMAKNQRNQQL